MHILKCVPKFRKRKVPIKAFALVALVVWFWVGREGFLQCLIFCKSYNNMSLYYNKIMGENELQKTKLCLLSQLLFPERMELGQAEAAGAQSRRVWGLGGWEAGQ
jgi:hypothetical protein